MPPENDVLYSWPRNAGYAKFTEFYELGLRGPDVAKPAFQ